MDTSYSKYKERSPQETILTIQKILLDLNLFPVLRWEGENRNGFYATRLTLYPTEAGVNGKGTDPIYSTASAYGELMERLQNNILLAPPMTAAEREEAGLSFRIFPDEVTLPLESVLKNPDPFTRWLMDQLNGEDEWSDGEAFVRLFAGRQEGNDVLVCIPFADPANQRIVNVPSYLARSISGTNGMAAGNTLEEAMVQGLSELFEREANLRILEGKAVPPVIPDDVLRQYSVFSMIESLRKNENYRAYVLDCSMGKGWPVAALVVHDLQAGTFGVRFGAHPSFPVAVERCLTEAAQGKKLSRFVRTSRINTLANSSCNANRHNVITIGDGYYPESLFCQKPDWEFRPWTRFHGNDNREFLKELLDLLKEEGLTPLFRDVSFLGFPAVYMLVPGFETVTEFSGRSVRLKRTLDRASRDFSSFSDLSDDEIRRILRLLRVYKNRIFSRLIHSLTGSPVSDPRYSNFRIGAFLSLRIKDYASAADYFSLALRTESDPKEIRYLTCMKHYADLLEEGHSPEQAGILIRTMYCSEAAERVLAETENLSALLDKVLPKLPCPHCWECPMQGNGCGYEQEKELYIQVQQAMKTENVSQETLLSLLKQLW